MILTDTELAGKKRAMIAALRKTGNITAAAKAAKTHRSSHYDWAKNDPEYAAEAMDALEEAADHLEAEARRRAEKGTLEPVYGRKLEVVEDANGNKRSHLVDGRVGTIRRYSDTLLIFLLRAARPEKFRERSETVHKGGVTVTARYDLSKLSDKQLDALEDALGAASIED